MYVLEICHGLRDVLAALCEVKIANSQTISRAVEHVVEIFLNFHQLMLISHAQKLSSASMTIHF